MSDLESILNISAGASGGVGLFSASDRFDFAKGVHIQATSLVLVIYAERKIAFVQIDEPKLSPDAAPFVSEGKAEEFAQRFGDTFVRGIRSGGQFFGVYRIDTKSEQSRQTVANSLSGSYGPFSADVTAKLQQTCHDEQAQIYADAHIEGGVVTVMPNTPENLLAAMTQWVQTVDSHPLPYFVELAPYIVASGPEPPNAADLQHQKDVLVSCARLRSQTLDKLNLIEYIMNPLHTSEFSGAEGGPDLAQLHAGLSDDLDVIAGAASWAINNPKNAYDAETYARTKIVDASGNVIQPGRPDYKMTVLPPNMPKHDGATVFVPNFLQVTSTDQANQIASAGRVSLHWTDDGNVSDNFQIVGQDPAPATPVSPGSTVTLKAHISKLAWALRQHGVDKNAFVSRWRSPTEPARCYDLFRWPPKPGK